MPAYIISRVDVGDEEAMRGYFKDAPETVISHGGRYLLRTSDFEVLEGQADYNRMVVLEFPDRDSALAWYHSDEYRELRETRWQFASAHIVVA